MCVLINRVRGRHWLCSSYPILITPRPSPSLNENSDLDDPGIIQPGTNDETSGFSNIITGEY